MAAILASVRAYSTSKDSGGKTGALGDLIYTGSVNRGVYIAKYISLSSSAIGMCIQPWLLTKMAASAAVFKVAMLSATGLFVFGTPFLLHFLCKRYVTEMYYDKDTNTFTAVRLNFFARPKRLSFAPYEICDSASNPFSNYQVGDNAMLIDTNVIRELRPDVYIIFMRYDEPIDLDKYISKDK